MKKVLRPLRQLQQKAKLIPKKMIRKVAANPQQRVLREEQKPN